MTWDTLSSGHPPGHSSGPAWVKVFVEEVWQRVAQILGDSEWRGPCPRCDGELRIRGDETILRGEWAERRLKRRQSGVRATAREPRRRSPSTTGWPCNIRSIRWSAGAAGLERSLPRP